MFQRHRLQSRFPRPTLSETPLLASDVTPHSKVGVLLSTRNKCSQSSYQLLEHWVLGLRVSQSRRRTGRKIPQGRMRSCSNSRKRNQARPRFSARPRKNRDLWKTHDVRYVVVIDGLWSYHWEGSTVPRIGLHSEGGSVRRPMAFGAPYSSSVNPVTPDLYYPGACRRLFATSLAYTPNVTSHWTDAVLL